MFWSGRPLKRNTRRVLVIVALVSLALYLGLGLCGDKYVWGGFLPLLLYWSLWTRFTRSTSLFGKTLFFRSKRKEPLDERQQSLRNRAFYLAYLVAAPLSIISYCLVDFFRVGAEKIPFYLSDFISLVLYANLTLVTSLPVLYVAWLEPDPLQDDENSTPENRSVAT